MRIDLSNINIWPTYNPDNRTRLPRQEGRQGGESTYDYGDLVVTTGTGQLLHRQNDARTTSWELVNPETDNGKRQDRLTRFDNKEVVSRHLDPDKAAFLKPIWAKGHQVKTGVQVAKRDLKKMGKQVRGYSYGTVKKYWAAFSYALEASLELAPTPESDGGEVQPLKAKVG
ncbi:MAG: hypothetical protein AAFY91_10570 [Bacteroidota bacterium]